MNVITATAVQEKQMTFVIDAENSITMLGDQPGDSIQGERFGSQQELAELAASWPANRLVEVWNSIPGLTPVKKFTGRKSAVARIWKAIQNLNGSSPEPATATKGAKAAKPAKSKKASKQAKATKSGKGKAAKGGGKASPAREGSKKAEVLALLQRKNGATLTEIMKATGWQAHSVRGFISGALGKKMGLAVESARREDGERVYTLTR
jgi:hypothetical protein